MRRTLVICLALLIAFTAGCAKKEAEQKDFQKDTKKVAGGSLVDPVDKQPVDISTSKYSYIYKDIEYNFNSKDNMEAFMKDPEKYLKKD
jgi:YHS domain-containing protein